MLDVTVIQSNPMTPLCPPFAKVDIESVSTAEVSPKDVVMPHGQTIITDPAVWFSPTEPCVPGINFGVLPGPGTFSVKVSSSKPNPHATRLDMNK